MKMNFDQVYSNKQFFSKRGISGFQFFCQYEGNFLIISFRWLSFECMGKRMDSWVKTLAQTVLQTNDLGGWQHCLDW